MDFSEDPVLDAIRTTVQRVYESEIAPNIGQYESSGDFPYSIIRAMGDAGLFGAAFPDEFGGTGAGFAAVAAIAEEISRLSPGFGYAMNMQAMTCPFTIFNWGTPEQARKYVPELISGRKIGMFALTEPGGGSDPGGAMRTTARRDGESYVLNGSKIWITFSNAADIGVLFAKTDPDAGKRGISAFIVEPKSAPGYNARPIDMRPLSNCLRSCEVFLEDFRVPVANRLGAEGDGLKIALNALEYGRLTVSGRLVGLAQACFDETLRYAREREVGGQTIGHYQMIQHPIADVAVGIDAARLMLQRMAWLMDNGERSTRAAARAKYLASEVAQKAAQTARDTFAAYALAEEYPINKLTAYVNMLTVGEGTPNVQRVLIAEDALGFKDANRHPVMNPLRKSL
ncbi:acyl-CoA dehydrogenase family protein [Nisaea acidiphila]|uniref:Acyl-CoA dehydrogenase family protein n=1 Tax=Nisaea acidiphila TaxID=1862145 RepID=A0A9J7AUI1_9PROT|nr:acyl-CoA dehydrogenase family protein [Nisaea acidiphila]UUX49972.1 acyl-CoA dehydrogenase family protein [Nisaea acidiphila]